MRFQIFKRAASIVFASTLCLFLPLQYVLALQPTESPIATDELVESATWQLKSDAQAVTAFEEWIAESQLPSDSLVTALKEFRSSQQSTDDSSQSTLQDKLDRVISAIAGIRPDIAKVADQLSHQRNSVIPPNFSHIVDNANEHPFVRNHVRLLIGRWLAQNQFYDETLQQLDTVEIDRVLAPESVLFYRAMAEHQLLRKEECKKTIDSLLQHENELPDRFAVVAKIMLSDLSPVEDGSLDEISRLMKDVYRRTQFQRSGKLVLDQEAEVIKKLDALIEKAEQQQQQQQSQSQSQPGSGNQPGSSPMDDSKNAGGSGDGKVTNKAFADGGQWGDLPPAKRAAAMAEMVKDMPPHYRSAIEEYFRRLAKEEQ